MAQDSFLSLPFSSKILSVYRFWGCVFSFGVSGLGGGFLGRFGRVCFLCVVFFMGGAPLFLGGSVFLCVGGGLGGWGGVVLRGFVV